MASSCGWAATAIRTKVCICAARQAAEYACMVGALSVEVSASCWLAALFNANMMMARRTPHTATLSSPAQYSVVTVSKWPFSLGRGRGCDYRIGEMKISSKWEQLNPPHVSTVYFADNWIMHFWHSNALAGTASSTCSMTRTNRLRSSRTSGTWVCQSSSEHVIGGV